MQLDGSQARASRVNTLACLSAHRSSLPTGLDLSCLIPALQGRHVLWGWLQERRKVGSYDYAGCLSVPRVLYIRDNRLVQARL